MDFIVTSRAKIHYCTQCGQHYDQETTCCCFPTQVRYLAEGKGDLQFASAVLECKPNIGDIVASMQPQWNSMLTSHQIISKLQNYSAALATSLLACNSNFYNSVACAVILCLFGRTDVQVPPAAQVFVKKSLELMCTLQVVTGNMVKINQTGVNCVFIDADAARNIQNAPTVYFGERNLKIAVLPIKKEEKTVFQNYSAEQLESTQLEVVRLHEKLHNCTPVIDAKMLSDFVVSTRLYEAANIVVAISRICEMLPSPIVFEAAKMLLENFRDKGINNIIQ